MHVLPVTAQRGAFSMITLYPENRQITITENCQFQDKNRCKYYYPRKMLHNSDIFHALHTLPVHKSGSSEDSDRTILHTRPEKS